MLCFSAPGHSVLSSEQTKLDPVTVTKGMLVVIYCKKNKCLLHFLPEDGIIINNLGFLNPPVRFLFLYKANIFQRIMYVF